MTKEFVPYELALKLKELGFNEPCFGYYFTLNGTDWNFADNYEFYQIDDQLNIGHKFTLLAPIFQQAFRWFREKYDMSGEINSYYSDKKWSFNYDIVTIYKEKASDRFDAYEEAELACLEKLIEIVESKKEEE